MAEHVSFQVEVRDDHDGGSIWYTEREFCETQAEAEEDARVISHQRENGAARVVRVTTVPIVAVQDGAVVTGEDAKWHLL